MLETTKYVIAGGFKFISILKRSINEIKEEENIDIDIKNIEKFCQQNFSKVLYTFASNIVDERIDDIRNPKKYCRSVSNLLQKSKSLNISNMEKYLDSGGFQISMGHIRKDYIDKFLDTYYNFLNEYTDTFDYAFSLDIPPNETIFNSFDEIKSVNRKSYEKLYYNLSKDVLDKLIYVYHFRTPKINEMWYDITFGKDGIFNNFDIRNWSVGGIVTNAKSDTVMRYVMYALPLTIILKKLIERNVKKFNFHVLGACTYKDILFYSLVEKLIKDKFDIEINITFDSTGLFKQLLIGRFLDFKEDGDFNIHKVFVSTKDLYKNNKSYKNYKNIDICFLIFDMISEKFNMPKLNYKSIYNEETGTFYRTAGIYLCMYMLHFYYQLQNDCKNLTEDVLYPLYKINKKDFDEKIKGILLNLNRNTLSKRIENKLVSFSKSLELIENLDEKYITNIINKYLDKDEFINLVRKIPTF